jgi:hypothetical protein
MEVRKSRAEAVVASASKTRTVLHLPDGPEQVNRDDRIGRASVGESVNPDLWYVFALALLITCLMNIENAQGRQVFPTLGLGHGYSTAGVGPI